MTLKQFEGLSVEKKNRMVAEAMGKCWHEQDPSQNAVSCKHCGRGYNINETFNYLTSDSGLREMLEYAVKKDYIVEIFVSLVKEEGYGVRFKSILSEIEDIIEYNTNLNLALCLAVLTNAGKIEEE